MTSLTIVASVSWWRNPPRSTPHRDWHTAYGGANWTGPKEAA